MVSHSEIVRVDVASGRNGLLRGANDLAVPQHRRPGLDFRDRSLVPAGNGIVKRTGQLRGLCAAGKIGQCNHDIVGRMQPHDLSHFSPLLIFRSDLVQILENGIA